MPWSLPRGPPDEDASALVSIRTGTNTSSECVGTLHLRLDSSLANVRHQLVSLALAAKKSRKGTTAPPPPPPPTPTGPLPPLSDEQREKLSKIRLHAFDFSTHFQFIRHGGVRVIPTAAEATLQIKQLFPVLPNIGPDFPKTTFRFPEETEVVSTEPPRGKKRPKNIRMADVGDYAVGFAVLFVRQKSSDHSEKVVMERLLMQNNVFGRLQTPQQLGTLISKHNANTKDFMGRTILQECAQEGNYHVVGFLTNLSFVQIEAKDWRGQTALHLAVDRGHPEVISLLLDAGADVLEQDSCGRTPLHISLSRRTDVLAARLCARLHSKGVTHEQVREAKDMTGKCPIELFSELTPSFSELCRIGQLTPLRALWSHYLFDRRQVLECGMGGRTSLHEAVDAGQVAVVDFLLNEVGMEALLEGGCVDDSQRSPLHVAAQRGLTAIAKRLMQSLNPNLTDCNIRTPLHLALLRGHADTAEAILEGAVQLEVNIMDINYCTPLHLAAAANMHRCCELLLTKHNASANLRGFSKVVSCIRRPSADLTAMPAHERAAHRRRIFQKERKWRMRSWHFLRYDNDTKSFKARSDFSSEGRLSDWRESRITALRPKSEEDGGPQWEQRAVFKGGAMLNWNRAFAHQPNVKFSDYKNGDKLAGAHHEDKRLSSGLFWLREAKCNLTPRAPLVEVQLHRRPHEDLGISFAADCVIDGVGGGSPAERAGLDHFQGYRVTEAYIDLSLEKSAGGRGIGLRCEGSVVKSVDNGSAADVAGIAPRMRIVSILQKSSGEKAHIPHCNGIVESVIKSATSEKMTITVCIPVASISTLDRLSGDTVGLRLEHASRPRITRAPKQYSLEENTYAFPSILACAVSGKNYQAVAALLFKHGAVQADTEGTETLAKVCRKLIDDRLVDLAGHVVQLMGDNKGGLLHHYVAAGNHDAVRWLVEQSCPLTEVHGRDKLTPLALAAKLGDSRAVTFLLEQGAEQTLGEGGSDALLQAILAGRDNIATLLVSNRSTGHEPLHMAAAKGLLKFVKALVGAKADVVNLLNPAGRNCLYVALEAAPCVVTELPAKVLGRRRHIDEPSLGSGFFLRDTDTAAGRAPKTKAVRRKHTDPQALSEVSYEELVVFLCSKGIDLAGSQETHPLDYVDLAASKGMWAAVDALLDLTQRSFQTDSLARPAPFTDMHGPAGGGVQLDRALCRANPSRTAHRDVFSYAAAAGQEALLARLVVQWGLLPSPGCDAAPTPRNALDYAFCGNKVDPCLMLLSRGLLPTRECESTSREVRALFAAVFHFVAPAVLRRRVGRKGVQKWEAPAVPFPKLPVNIFTYALPGASVMHPKVGDRLQVPHHGGLHTGTVLSDDDGVLTVRIDGSTDLAAIDFSNVVVFYDTGRTLIHELVARGHSAFIDKLVRFGASNPTQVHRFSADRLPENTGGSLLYHAVLRRQETVLASLIDTHNVKITADFGKSPLIAAILLGSLPILQKLVQGGQDVNQAAVVQDVPTHRSQLLKDVKGRSVSPLYLACMLLESEMVLLLLSRHADPSIGRGEGDTAQSPLHVALSVAGTAVVANSTTFCPKRQIVASASARKIASGLVRVLRDTGDTAHHGGAPLPTHVLNLAAKKGYFTVVHEMLRKNVDVAAAVAAAYDDATSSFIIPHVLHYLAGGGELEMLKLAVGQQRVAHGATDLLLPEGAAGDGVLRVASRESDKRRDLGTTADCALHAHHPATLAFLLARGVRLSRVAAADLPRALPFVARVAKTRHDGNRRNDTFDRVPLDAALTPIGVPYQLRALLDIVERPSSQKARFNYLHASALKPACGESGRFLLQERYDVNETYTDPLLGELSAVWLCAARNNTTLMEAVLQAPALRISGRSPVPFAVMNGHRSVVTRLIELGADVNYCETLMYPSSVLSRVLPVSREAVQRHEVVRFGADHYVTEMTAVWYAASKGMEDVVALLHAHGADLQNAATTARRSLHPTLLSYHAKPRTVMKVPKPEDVDDYYQDDGRGEVESDATPSFRVRIKREVARRKRNLVKNLELDEAEDSIAEEAIVHAALVATFGSLRGAYRASCRSGACSSDSVAAVCSAAGLEDHIADHIAGAVTRGMSFAAFKVLFPKRAAGGDGGGSGGGGAVSVSYLEHDAVKLRPIWAVVACAPMHPCKSKSKQALRDKCDQFIRTARYIIRSDGLRGMTPEELTALVLVACQRGHWEIAVLIVKEGGRASRSGESKDSHFLTEVSDADVRGFSYISARHPLHMAARHLDRDMFTLFLKRCKKQDIATLRDPSGFTALHCAILSINSEVVDLLLDLDYMNVETPAGTGTRSTFRVLKGKVLKEEREASSGMTPLMLACRVNSQVMATRVLAGGAAINATDTDGNTALIHAAEMGNFQVVETLVSKNADVGVLNKYGYTALMRACARGHNDVALPLLQYWTRHDGLLSPTTSVLHCAAEGGCESVVEMLTNDFDMNLIDVLAHDNHRSTLHSSALWKAWALGKWGVQAKLIAHIKKREDAGCMEPVESEMDQRILAQLSKTDTAPSDEVEDTLLPGWLSHACELAARIHAKLKKIRGTKKSFPTELVDAPTIPPLRESLRVGCTHVRIRCGKDVTGVQLQDQGKLASLCLTAAQRMRAERRKEWTLLEWAVRANHAVVVKVLGDRSLPDRCGALHLAAERGNLDIVQILLQLQMSSVSSLDNSGRTALMRSIASGREKVALFLMSKTPARKLLKLTPDGRTLLHMCATSGLEDAVTHMIGCLVQLERRLKGEDNLSLHDFINIPDKHPGLTDYDSEDEEDEQQTEKPREEEAPTTGFTPFEYALMFGKPAIALRLAYGSTMSSVKSASPSISLNPRFPGSAGYYLPIMSPSVRATLSEFFNDPSRSFNAGPFTIRGDFVRHPSHWSPNDEGKWPKEKSVLTFSRLTWPDVRAIGLTNLSKIPWVSEKLAEIVTFEHERSKYAQLLACLDLQNRAFRLNTASLNDLGPEDRLVVLQRLASALIVHRYTPRDYDWTSTTGAIQDTAVVGMEKIKRRKPKTSSKDSRMAVAADGLAGQVTCVQMEYVSDPSQVKVTVDSEGVVHERFTIVNGSFVCGNVEAAIEAHFRRKERIATGEADLVLKEVTAWLRGQANPLVKNLSVSVDWKAIDKYRFDSASDRIKSFEVLTSNRGIWSIVPALQQISNDDTAKREKIALFPYSGIVFRRAGWIDGQFFTSEKDAQPENELVVHYDVRGGNAHFSSITKSLSRLFLYHEVESLRMLMIGEQETFKQRVAPVLPNLRSKFEVEGGWKMLGGLDMVLMNLRQLMDDICDRLHGFVKVPPKRKEKRSNSVWQDLSRVPQDVTLQTLLQHALKTHIKSIGLLVSSKREPTAKLAAVSKTVIACAQTTADHVKLPSNAFPHPQLLNAFYFSVVDAEVQRLQERAQSTLADAQQRLITYLPATTLSIEWSSFADLEPEARLLALGVFCHGRGVKVLQPLISGMSAGWDSKLGVFVREYVHQVVIHCTSRWQSSTAFVKKGGVFHYYTSLLAAAAGGKALLTAQEIATDLITHLEEVDSATDMAPEKFFSREVARTDVAPRACIADYVDPTHAIACWCTFNNLRDIVVGRRGKFHIRARNFLNCLCTRLPSVSPTQPFVVRLTTPLGELVDAQVSVTPPADDQDASLYTVRYVAPAVGSYLINVMVNGEHISRSPCNLRVFPPADPEVFVASDPQVNTILVKMPVIFSFHAEDNEGNRLRHFSPPLKLGTVVTLKEWSVVRKLQRKHGLDMPSMSQDDPLPLGKWLVKRTFRSRNQVVLAQEESAGQDHTFAQACLVDTGVTFSVSSDAGGEMDIGPVLDEHNGECSVRCLPKETGDYNVTVTMTRGSNQLTCTRAFNVVDARQGVEHMREFGLKHWEKKLRRIQTSKWDKEGWARWRQKQRAQTTPCYFAQRAGGRDTRDWRVAADVTQWTSSLRQGAPSARKTSTFNEWMTFRRECVTEVDTNVIPDWWLRDADTDRKATLRTREECYPVYQEKLLLRAARFPQEVAKALTRNMTLPSSTVNAFAEGAQQSTSAPVRCAKLGDLLSDHYLQLTLDNNGGATVKYSRDLPLNKKSDLLSEEELELKLRRNDAAMLTPVLTFKRGKGN